MQLNTAHPKICSAQVNCKVKTLHRISINTNEISGSQQTFSVPFGTAVTYVGIWLKSPPSSCRPLSVIESEMSTASYFVHSRKLAPTHLFDELLNTSVDIFGWIVKLRSHSSCPIEKRHFVWPRNRQQISKNVLILANRFGI